MKLEYLSASRIGTFKQCQLKYYAIYDLGLKDRYTHPLTIMGSAVHKAMEISANALILGRHRNLWDPLKLVEPVCRKYKVKEDLHDLTRQLIQNAVNWGYFDHIDNTHACELKFHEPFLADETKIKGFIDRLDIFDSRADIVDIKTQKKAYTQKELDTGWQARIYNLAVRELFPQIEDVSVSFWVLRHLVQRVQLTAEDAENDKLRLLEIANEIRNCKNPIGTTTALCNWCPYKYDCPTKNSGIKARFKWSKK